MPNSSIYLNCGCQTNLVGPYVAVGIYVNPEHASNVGTLLKQFPHEVRDLSSDYTRNLLETFYRIYCIFESRGEDQPIIGDFILLKSEAIDKYGHHVACMRTIRSLSIRMRALTNETPYCFISDGSLGSEVNDLSFRIAALYSRYIRSFFICSYKHHYPYLPTKMPISSLGILPNHYVKELLRRMNK